MSLGAASASYGWLKVGPALLAKLLQSCPVGLSQPPNVASCLSKGREPGTRKNDFGLGDCSSRASKADGGDWAVGGGGYCRRELSAGRVGLTVRP